MSAVPPRATDLVHRNELTRGAPRADIPPNSMNGSLSCIDTYLELLCIRGEVILMTITPEVRFLSSYHDVMKILPWRSRPFPIPALGHADIGLCRDPSVCHGRLCQELAARERT